MDWNLAIKRNREALKRILAMLVAMAGITVGPRPRGGWFGWRGTEALADQARARKTLPRHLHRAILRLLGRPSPPCGG